MAKKSASNQKPLGFAAPEKPVPTRNQELWEILQKLHKPHGPIEDGAEVAAAAQVIWAATTLEELVSTGRRLKNNGFAECDLAVLRGEYSKRLKAIQLTTKQGDA